MALWRNRKVILITFSVCSLIGCGESETSTNRNEVTKSSTNDHGTDSGSVNAISSDDRSGGANRMSLIRFQEMTKASGLQFVNRNGEEGGHFSIVESLGGGVGIIDVDGDGLDDLFLPGGGTLTKDARPVGLPAGLFRNRGHWKFTDISTQSGTAVVGFYSHGVACGDFDNDGFTDALITGYGGLQLFHNLGDGTFEEVSSRVGLTDALWSSSAAWGDVTGDGILDVYISHYVDWRPDKHPFCPGPGDDQREVCPPRDFTGLPDSFYVGSAECTFRDASAEFGVAPNGKGLGVLIADLDNDHDPDIYVTNDTVSNAVYSNEMGQSLADVSLVSGASLSARGVPDGSMGVQLLDYDQDGAFDVWVANYERETSALYNGKGGLLFGHASQRTGVTAVGAQFVGWGTLCFDADHDGDEDVFVSNGHVIRYPRSAPLRQKPLFFENLNGKRFNDVANTAGDYMSQPHMARGSATADFDNDGDLDIAVLHTNEPASILQNICEGSGFLTIQLTGVSSSRDAIGTVVEVVADGRRMFRQWIGGGSYASTSSRRLHFGLGAATIVNEINIQWPSGIRQSFTDVSANSRIAVVESRDSIVRLQE